MEKTKVYNPEGELLNPYYLAEWANKVSRQAGGKGTAFKPVDFVEGLGDRLRGHHCDCGVNKAGYSAGEFVLLPLDDEGVLMGGKAYMKCKICGCHSHL